eukprot:Gregarina_sp_Pseudo_9__3426@NODE_359_length_3065_cov_10_955056_g338_i0_p2_GENE_NODE_359_length_3065_cov_10_955056_g338_i0NODE_359_length_3065_cov_10_955056_g338_i0_p2_ORF_typecomplete_len242_score40_67_NODE_359_length_3065_cov_10_955056_g338_i084809
MLRHFAKHQATVAAQEKSAAPKGTAAKQAWLAASLAMSGALSVQSPSSSISTSSSGDQGGASAESYLFHSSISGGNGELSAKVTEVAPNALNEGQVRITIVSYDGDTGIQTQGFTACGDRPTTPDHLHKVVVEASGIMKNYLGSSPGGNADVCSRADIAALQGEKPVQIDMVSVGAKNTPLLQQLRTKFAQLNTPENIAVVVGDQGNKQLLVQGRISEGRPHLHVERKDHVECSDVALHIK